MNQSFRHTRRAVLLVAVSILPSAATARAECAWVLWSHNVSTEVEKWSLRWDSGMPRPANRP